MLIDNKEIFRYSGYRNNVPDENVIELIEQIKSDVLKNMSPKNIYKEVCFEKQNNSVIIENKTFISERLVNHLKNSEKLIIFAATLGTESDRIIRKYSALSTAKSVLSQAVLTAAIESYCDEVCEQIAEKEKKNGFFLRPRFSPGYGDLRLEYQKEIFSILDITKRIGVSLTDNCLMIPSKSVTAFIGLTRDDDCSIQKCATCDNLKCEFRRGN